MAYENVTHIDLSIGKSGVVKTTLVDNDFEENSLTISASSTASSGFNIGGACKKQLSITLTRDGLEKLKSSSVLRRKACLHVIAEETDGTLSDWGYFYITEPTVDDYYAELICYDGMVAFDKKIPESVSTEMQSEHTIEELFQLCVSNCTTNFYELSFDSSSIKVNSGLSLKLASDSTIDTYLSCIEYLSAIAGGFAEVDTKGTLKISYYSKVRKEGVSAEPDDIQDFKQDFAMSKVAVVKTSVGGFDYTMGVEASESDYDQLTVEQYENPFLRGFISEGEESKNPNIESIFNKMASTIIDMTFYGSNCAVPARGGINLGDLIGTTREVASVGSGVVDYEAEADILVTDYTWGYQNQINFKCNASVSNINPSSSGLNKGSVYKPVSRPGSGGEDDRLDEIANRLEDLGEQSFHQNMNLLNWAILARQQPLTDKSGTVIHGIKKISINRGDIRYINIKNVKVNGRIMSETVMPELDWSDFAGLNENDIVLGKSLSVGCVPGANPDNPEEEGYLTPSGGFVNIKFIVKNSGDELTFEDLFDPSMIELSLEFFAGTRNDDIFRSNFKENLFTSTGKFYYGQGKLGTQIDYTNAIKEIPHKIYAEIINHSVDDDTFVNLEGMSDVIDLYLVVLGSITGSPGIDSDVDSLTNFSPLSVHFLCSVQNTPNVGDLYNWHLREPDEKTESWWQKYFEEINYALDVTFGLELASSPEVKTSLMAYEHNPNTIDIIVKAIKDGVLPRNVEDLYTWVGYISESLSSLNNYVLNYIGDEEDKDYTNILNKIDELTKSLETLTKEVSDIKSNYGSLSSSVEKNTKDITGLDERVKKLEDNQGGGDTPTGSSKTPIARYTNETEVVIDSSHSDILSMQLEVEKDTNTMLSFSATGGMSSEGLLDFHVFYDNSEIAFNPKFYVSKPYETISFSTSFLPISKDKRVILSITCTTSDASINFLKDSISVSVINAELPKSDTEFNYAVEDFVVPVSAVQLHEVNDSVTTQ